MPAREIKLQMLRIGALLNIDLGQTVDRIDRTFDTMRACGLMMCRVIVGPAYAPDVLDLYDKAFDSASERGMEMVVTLRGGEDFCRAAVRRYAPRKNLRAWDVSEAGPGIAGMVGAEDPGREIISWGLSLLPGIDYDGYGRRMYEVVTAARCDMARAAHEGSPFWVTGIQGGGNLFSGTRSFSPTPGEIAQWLWTAVASGADGIFLQSVNSRKEGQGAGEMSLLNMQGGMTGRAEAVRDIIAVLNEYEDIFGNAKPVFSPVTMIYTKESIAAESVFHRDDLESGDYEVRQKGGSSKAAIAIYQVLMERGINPDFREISEYDWERPGKGRCIVFAGQLSVPTRWYDSIRAFVKSGGKVIVEGLSFSYDENMNSVFSSDFPLVDVFGGYVEEYSCRPGNYRLRIDGKRYWVHLFDGIIHNEASGESLRILRNRYGRGSVTWIPSVIGLGAQRAGHRSRISRFFKKELADIAREMPLRFRRRYPGICCLMLETGDSYVTVVTSNRRHRRRVAFSTELRIRNRLYWNDVNGKEGKARNRKVKVHAGQTVVALWNKKR